MTEIQRLCRNCEYYLAKIQECHRYAPYLTDVVQQKKIRWPGTPPIGSCGEFKPK